MNLSVTSREPHPQTVLVTGASSGIGRAIAEAFAARGAQLVLVARDAARVEAAADAAARAGASAAVALPGDVAGTDVLPRAVARADARFGRLDAAVFNTGGPPEGTSTEVSDEAWRTAFDAHVLAPVRLIRACRDVMRRQGRGRIVLVSSVAARQPIDRLAVSSVLRAGLLGLVKTTSRELGPEGITVNAVLPGFTATERLRSVLELVAAASGRPVDEVAAAWAASVPAKRLARPAEIARAVVFLAGDDAGYITGVSLPVDGGWLAGI